MRTRDSRIDAYLRFVLPSAATNQSVVNIIRILLRYEATPVKKMFVAMAKALCLLGPIRKVASE